VTRFEQVVHDWLQKNGWKSLRKGWPDFMCWRQVRGPMKLMAIEVKASSDKLSDDQKEMHRLLRLLGVPVHVIKEGQASLDRLPNGGRMACSGGDIREALKAIDHIKDTIESLNERLSEIRDWVSSVTVPFDIAEPRVIGLATINSGVEKADASVIVDGLRLIQEQAEQAQKQVLEDEKRRAVEALPCHISRGA